MLLRLPILFSTATLKPTSRLMSTMDGTLGTKPGAAERNKGPIMEQLVAHNMFVKPCSQLPLHVLEIAAGNGPHTSYFTAPTNIPNLASWQPTDPSSACLAAINSLDYTAASCLVSPACPLTLSSTTSSGAVEDEYWAADTRLFDAMLVINMVHIAPWDATLGLMKFASGKLTERGAVVLYGPYMIDGVMGDGNERFDESLRARDATWGVRELREVEFEAGERGLELVKVIDMPANNNMAVFQRKHARI